MSLEEAERVWAAMRELKAERFHDSNTELAAAIGTITPQAVSQNLSGKNRPRLSTVRAVAKLKGITEWALLGQPAPMGSDRFLEYEPDYPELAKAVRAARELGYRADAIAIVESARLRGADRPAKKWLEEIEYQIRRLSEAVQESSDTAAADAVKGRMVAARERAAKRKAR